MAELKIIIDRKDYSIKIEGIGYTGGKCIVEADELQKILGMSTDSQKLKPEYQRRVSVQKTGR